MPFYDLCFGSKDQRYKIEEPDPDRGSDQHFWLKDRHYPSFFVPNKPKQQYLMMAQNI